MEAHSPPIPDSARSFPTGKTDECSTAKAGVPGPGSERFFEMLIRVLLWSSALFVVLSGACAILREFGGRFLPQPGGYRLAIEVLRPLLFFRVGEIFAWDVGLTLVALMVTARTVMTRRIEALLAFTLCLTLWRIVLTNVLIILMPTAGWVMGGPQPGPYETLLVVGILGIGKETIARFLLRRDASHNAPLLAFFAWHHRKDAVFNSLFAISVLGTLLNIPFERSQFFFAFIKIVLLGTAAWGISARCASILTETESRHRDC
jgi:hypothetical protein